MAPSGGMGRTKSGNRRRRPSLVDRMELRLSTHRQVDGLWVGTFEAEPETTLRRVEEALALIKAHDRLRYDRITRDLKRVWVRVLSGPLGQFNEALGACELDERFVLAATSSPAAIAATIVHEATHARLLRRGIGYEEKMRARVEAVCFRRELAFARKLPAGAEVRERAEYMLEATKSEDYWSNAAFSEQWAAGSIAALRHLGAPIWLARLATNVGRLQIVGRQKLRRMLRQEKSPATVIASEAKQSQPQGMSK